VQLGRSADAEDIDDLKFGARRGHMVA
jgi:hypothetical protein